jgi:hypothetical protein
MKARSLAFVVVILALAACRTAREYEEQEHMLESPPLSPGGAGKDVPDPAITPPPEDPEARKR